MATTKRKPYVWFLLVALIALCYAMPHLEELFHYLFPKLHRPVYTQTSFIDLLISHVLLVGASSLISVIIGVGVGLFVTRPYGEAFRSLMETFVAICQTFPPVAVLAIAAPLIGMGVYPALIALILYGLSPIVQSTVAAINSIDKVVLEVATGLGMSAKKRLLEVEMPLAMPTILAGIRISVSINIGTAAIASTVGATTLGTPIIIGLTGFNMAYVIQGALIVTLLAISVDLLFERLQQYVNR